MSAVITISILWLFWASWVPMLWRWRVTLPKARDELLKQPDTPRKAVALRRIHAQMNHNWAGSQGIFVFSLFTMLLIGLTLMVFLVPQFR